MARRALEIVITGDSKGASRAFRGVERDAGTLTGRLQGVGAAAARTFGLLGGAYAASAAVRKITTDTVNFDKSMRNVNSIAQLNEKQYEKLSKSVLKLAGPTAQAPQTLADGLYDLVSSGFDAKDSLTVLESSARAATAGLTTTEVSTKAVAAVLNAYRMPAGKASDVSDVLFRTVDRGVISFEELSTSVGDVLPFASSLGISLREVGASTATMTKAGIQAPESMTRIKNVMTTLLKPGTDLQGVLKDLGFETGEAIIKQEGFQGALDAIVKTAGGSKEAVAALFPNIRSLGGVLALTGENSRNAAEDLRGMNDAGGATAKALKEQSKSISFQWNRLKAKASELSIQFGMKLVPAMKEVLGVFSDDSLSGTEKLNRIGKVLTEQISVAAEKIPDIVAAVAPAVAKAAAVLGVAVMKGLVAGFVKTDLLGKVLMGASLVAIVGGPAALMKSGALVGTLIGRGVALAIPASMMSGIVTLLGASVLSGGPMKLIGATLAKFMATSVGRAIPLVFAAAGIGSAIYSAINGDMKDAGFKAGGALVGGIAGFMLGGPVGAMIGVGLGSALGGVISGLFGQTKQVNKLQDEIQRGAVQMAQGIKAESAAIGSLRASSNAVSAARGKQRKATNEVRQAELALIEARRAYGPATGPAIAAEARLALAKNRSTRAAKAAKDAQRQEGVVRRATIDIMRNNVAGDKQQIASLRQRRKEILRNLELERNKANPRIQRQSELVGQLGKNNRELNKTQASVSKTIRNAAVQIGPQFAKSLEKMTTATSIQMKALGQLGKIVPPLKRSWLDITPTWDRVGRSAKQGFAEAGNAIEGFSRGAANRRQAINANMRAMPPVQVAATGLMIEDFNAKKSALTGGGSPQARRRGGLIRAFRGGGAVPAMVSPGELIEYGGKSMTVPGRPEPRDSVYAHLPVGARVYTFDGQQRMAMGEKPDAALRNQAPHFAAGGVVKPTISGGSPSARGLGNSAISRLHAAAVKSLDKISKRIAAASASGSFNYTGPPADFKQLGNNSYVDSNTYAVATYLAQRFGSTISSDWRSVAENNAANGSPTSSHLRGTPANPGAFDFVAPSTAMQAFVGSSIAGVTENDIHDYGSGLHNHIAFFRRGGKAGSCGCGSCQRKRKGGLVKGYRSGGVVKKAANILTRRGFDHKSIAGIMGNAWGESNWNPAAMEPGTDNGGLFGFTAYEKSRANLVKFAAKEGNDWTDVGSQVRFMLATGGASLKGRMNALDSIQDTTKLFMDEYERPGIPRLDTRIAGGFMASKYLRGIKFGSGGKGGAPAKPKAPELTAKQRKGKARLMGGSSKALSYARQVKGETKRPGLAKKAIKFARSAKSLAGDNKFKAARAALTRSENLAARAAKSIPGLKGSRGPFADSTFDPSKPFSMKNLPGFKNLPPAIRKLIDAPGLSNEGKLDLANTALSLAGDTATKKDDAAAYNLIIGLNQRKRKRNVAIVRKANKQLRKGGLTKKQQKGIRGRRDAGLVNIGAASTDISSARVGIRGLNEGGDGGSESDTAQAMKELTAAINEQNRLQSSVQATSGREAIRMLADVMSGQFVGNTNGFAVANPGVRY